MSLNTPTDGRNNAKISSTFDMLRKRKEGTRRLGYVDDGVTGYC